jgi:UDP-N-acetylmuramate dehydrogenase
MNKKKSFLKNTLFMNRAFFLKGKFTPNTLMKRYTTIRIGGTANGVYVPKDREDLKRFVLLCKENGISLLPIGKGSNIIVSDKGLNNIFLKLSSPYFQRITLVENSVSCGAGVALNTLCSFAERHSLGGAEFLTGIPATVGGAVFRNAGAYAKNIASILKEIECIDRQGNIHTIKRKDIDFKYRHSSLKDMIIMSACFKLKRSKKSLIRNTIKRYLQLRLVTQDYTAPSAGCVFKNPDSVRMSAGEMLDKCGLKGKRIGDAQISTKHANFMLNRGSASVNDLLRLISFAKKKVKAVYGVSLETEVEIF